MGAPNPDPVVEPAKPAVSEPDVVPEPVVGLSETQHCVARFAEEFVADRVVKHGELRRDLGLERKTLQQTLTEGVDGLDAQAARRFQRLGKQSACAYLLRRRRATLRKLGEISGELVVAVSQSMMPLIRQLEPRFATSTLR